MATTARTASFGPYALDLRSGELRKHGVRVKMGEQPFQILVMLLESPGEMVSREQLRAKLWVDDTFVDFDHGLNSAVQRLRDCLSDTAEKPLWVATIPRRGYRFVGKVEWSNGVRPPETAPNGDTAAATYDASLEPNGTTTTQTARRKKNYTSGSSGRLGRSAGSGGARHLLAAKCQTPRPVCDLHDHKSHKQRKNDRRGDIT
ncbi:MAG: winged helix-turn-helix domain-containing protein [Candidatus Acidiferrales bacterium]